MTTIKITTYVADAIELIGSYLNQIPELVTILSSYSGEAQALEDDLWDVLTGAGLSIDDSEGVQLDRIGKLIGQPRWDRSDADYRRLLTGRILVNSSTGTPEDLISIIQSIVGPVVITYERPGATAQAALSWESGVATSVDDERALVAFIEAGKPAGVCINLNETDTTVTPAFAFGTSGAGWGLMALDVRRMVDE